MARHTLFSEETRWPGYYYRADHPKLDDDNWHVFTGADSARNPVGTRLVYHEVREPAEQKGAMRL